MLIPAFIWNCNQKEIDEISYTNDMSLIVSTMFFLDIMISINVMGLIVLCKLTIDKYSNKLMNLPVIYIFLQMQLCNS